MSVSLARVAGKAGVQQRSARAEPVAAMHGAVKASDVVDIMYTQALAVSLDKLRHQGRCETPDVALLLDLAGRGARGSS